MWGLIAGLPAGVLGERAAGVLHGPTALAIWLGRRRGPFDDRAAPDRARRCVSRSIVCRHLARGRRRRGCVRRWRRLGSPPWRWTSAPGASTSPPRSLVMGILNRTPDSFFDQGGYYRFDDFLRKAEQLVADGADLLDVGGVKAGPGAEVSEAEELDRVVPAIEALCARFDVPVSVDTWRASVRQGRVRSRRGRRQRHQRVRRPGLPRRCARRQARRSSRPTSGLAPRVARSRTPSTTTWSTRSWRSCVERAARAEAAGIPAERIMVDAGLDLGKSEPQSLVLLRASRALAALGYPVLLSASNKRFLGELLDLDVGERREATVAAHALGIALGLPHPAGPRRARRSTDGRCARRGARGDGRDACTLPARATTRRSSPTACSELVARAGRRRRPRAWSVDDVSRRTTYEARAHRRRGADAAVPHEPRVVVARHIEQFTRQDDVARLWSTTSPTRSTRPSWCCVGGRHACTEALVDAVKSRPAHDRRHRPGPRPRRSGSTSSSSEAGGQARRGARASSWSSSSARTSAGSAALLDGARGDVRAGRAARATTTSSRSSARPAGCRRGSSPTRSTGATPPAALDRLHRMMGGGERHPLQILATLHGHYSADAAPRRARRDATRRRRPRCSGLQAARRSRRGRRSTRRGGSGRRAWRGPSSCWPAPTSTCGGALRVARRAGDGGAGGPAVAPRRRPAAPGRPAARTARRPALTLHEARLAPGGLRSCG